MSAPAESDPVQNDMLRFEVVTARKELRVAREKISLLQKEKAQLLQQLRSVQEEIDRYMLSREATPSNGQPVANP